MSYKISEEWFSPTDEMVTFHDRGNNWNYYEFKFPNGRHKSVKFKMRYNGKTSTFASHTENYAANVSKDKKTVTLHFPLTSTEQKYRNDNWRNLPDGYYEKNHVTISYEEFLRDVQFQFTGIAKYNAICDELEVGDFVQFSTQRDKQSWRKILKLDFENNVIYGWKYRQPIDDPQYDTRDSSDNMITAVVSHVKNNSR